MSCTNCEECVKFKCLALPQCPGDDDTFMLEIGTVEDTDTDYNLHVSNDSNGVVQMVPASSDGSGVVTADITALAPYLNDKTTFTLWLTEKAGQTHENVPFSYTVDGEPVETGCAVVRFEKLFDGQGFPHNILNQKLYV